MGNLRKKSYFINKCQVAPKIDGLLNDETWENANKAHQFT